MLRIERLRLASGEPMAIETTHLSAKRFPALRRSLVKYTSLYTALAEVYDVHLAEAEETIETSLATPREAGLLGTDVGLPMLMLSRHSLDAGGEPVEWVRSVYRGDRYKFVARLKRPERLTPPTPHGRSLARSAMYLVPATRPALPVRAADRAPSLGLDCRVQRVTMSRPRSRREETRDTREIQPHHAGSPRSCDPAVPSPSGRVVALVGAAGWAVLALARGEEISAAWMVAAAPRLVRHRATASTRASSRTGC